MELISLSGKTNFFEKKVSDYAKSGVNTRSAYSLHKTQGSKTDDLQRRLTSDTDADSAQANAHAFSLEEDF